MKGWLWVAMALVASAMYAQSAGAQQGKPGRPLDLQATKKLCWDMPNWYDQRDCISRVVRYSMKEINKQADLIVTKYRKAAKLPDDYAKEEGKEAAKAAAEVRSIVQAYETLIAVDCSYAARAMHGGFGSATIEEACKIEHLERLAQRLGVKL